MNRSQFSIPLSEKQLFCVRRNVEDLVLKKVGAGRLDSVFAGVYLQVADELQVAPSKRSSVVVEPADQETCQAVYSLMKSLLLQVLNPENVSYGSSYCAFNFSGFVAQPLVLTHVGFVHLQVDRFILEALEGRYGTGDTSNWLVPTSRTSADVGGGVQ